MERDELYAGFRRRITHLMKRSKKRTVQEVCRFGLQRSVMGIPTADAYTFNSGGITTPLPVVALVEADSVLPLWKEELAFSAAGSYHQPSKTLILQCGEYTELWREGVEAHELFHAWQDFRGELPWMTDRRSWIVGELAAYEFHGQALLDIGGAPYRQFHDEEVRQVLAWHKAQPGSPLPGDVEPPEFGYKPKLDEIFGVASERQQKNMIPTTYIHVMFGAIDRTHSDAIDRDNQKGTILHNLYKELGLNSDLR